MIERALIHVGGPAGCGKTAFIEAVLGASDEPILVARCIRDDSRREARETAPNRHPEIRRYRRAGASRAALFSFAGSDLGTDAFFLTELLGEFSRGVILEGDLPLGWVDLEVFVAPPPEPRERLFVRRTRDAAAEARARATRVEDLLQSPDGAARFLAQVWGDPLADLVRRHPEVLERAHVSLLEGAAAARNAPPMPVEHWAISERYAGIERAQLAVVNIRHEDQRRAGERLVAELARLRKEDELFDDILGWRGTRIPITAVVANLADPADAGRKKALARVRRALRRASS